MSKTLLSLSLIFTICSASTFAQTSISTVQTLAVAAPATKAISLDVSPKEAMNTINYKMSGGKMMVLATDHKESPVFMEKATSTTSEDTYRIYSAEGKTLIATYTVGKRSSDIKLIVEKDKTAKEFILGDYLARCSNDQEKEEMKHKIPVYWLYKNGYNK